MIPATWKNGVLAGPPDAETATEMTAWLSEGEIAFELYFVRDRVLASRPLIRFSSVTDAIVFRIGSTEP